jgi:predicted nucleic acid-binding protein
MIVVPDAGPLIYLGGAGHLDILRALYSEVVVPRIVFDEIVVAGAGLTGAREVDAARWIRIEDAIPDPSLLSTLGRGEAAAIPLAQRLGATLLADDADARAVAHQRGIVVIGTLGVLLAAKRMHLIAEVAPILVQMESLGMFVSARLRDDVLRLAGEPTR